MGSKPTEILNSSHSATSRIPQNGQNPTGRKPWMPWKIGTAKKTHGNTMMISHKFGYITI